MPIRLSSDIELPRRTKRRLWLLRRDRKNAKKRKRVRSNNVGASDSQNQPSTQGGIQHKKRRGAGLHFELPENLDFDENYEETAKKFHLVRVAVKGQKRLRSLSFDRIRKISPSAALVLASEVDRWNMRVGGKLKAAVAGWHDDVRRLLHQMGYFTLLELESPPILTAEKNTIFLQFKRGIAGERGGAELARELRVEIERIVGEKIKKHLLFEGLSEAITNVAQHAYPPEEKCRTWW